MRSPKEIRDRLRQELLNLAVWKFPPRSDAQAVPPSPLPLLPNPSEVASRLAQTSFPSRLRVIANEILAHRFPLLGLAIDTGPEIRWRKDYVSGFETDLR